MYQVIEYRNFNSFAELLERSSNNSLCLAHKQGLLLKNHGIKYGMIDTTEDISTLKCYEIDYIKFCGRRGCVIISVINLINEELAKRFCKIVDNKKET